MSSEIQVFENEKFGKIRTTIVDGETRFVAVDICRMLGHSNPWKAIKNHVAEEDKAQTICSTPGGDQKLLTVNESGLWALILGSKLPYAREIKHWVTSEVLPAIRAKGYYVNPAYDETREELIARALLAINEVNKEKEQRIQELEAERTAMLPKAAFADAVSGSQDGMLIGTLAAYLNENGVSIGRNRLFKQLRDEGYLHKRGRAKNLPTQKSLNLGLMSVRECVIHAPFGDKICHTTLVTGRGQQYFLGKYADVGQQYRQLPPGEEVSL